MNAVDGTLLVEAALKRDRALVLAVLALVVVLAWVYVGYLAVGMPGMAAEPSAASLGLAFVMWVVMMVAMMVPTAAPMVLLLITMNRRRHEQRGPLVPTSAFVGGYLIVWSGLAAVATGAQWALREAAVLSTTMGNVTPLAGGIILLAAGAFQWTRLKQRCLHHCRTPLGFLMTEWRSGNAGALTMGLRHGGFCLGCCGFLMGLMFVGGVMNLLWMAGLAVYVLLEKTVPAGEWLGRMAGLFLMAWGVWIIT